MAKRTANEQAAWDAIFTDLVHECVRQQGFRDAMGCLHLAREIADAALAERRSSIKEQQ